MSKNQLTSWQEFLAALEMKFVHSASSFGAGNFDNGNGVVSKKASEIVLGGFSETGRIGSDDLKDTKSTTGDPIFMVAELGFHYNKSQFLPGEDIKEFVGHDILKILVAETFLGPNDELCRSNQSLDYEISSRLEHKMEEHAQEFDKEDHFSKRQRVMMYIFVLRNIDVLP